MWRRAGTRLLSERFTIHRDSPERLRALGVPVFLPYALYDNGQYVEHYGDVQSAQQAAMRRARRRSTT